MAAAITNTLAKPPQSPAPSRLAERFVVFVSFCFVRVISLTVASAGHKLSHVSLTLSISLDVLFN